MMVQKVHGGKSRLLAFDLKSFGVLSPELKLCE